MKHSIELCKDYPTVPIWFDLKVDTEEELKIINDVIVSSSCTGKMIVETPYPTMISSLTTFSPMYFAFYLHPGSWPLTPAMDYTYYKTMVWSLFDDDVNLFSAPKDVYDKFSGMKTYKEHGYCMSVYGVDENDLNALPTNEYSAIIFDVPGRNPYEGIYDQITWPHTLLVITYILCWFGLIVDIFTSYYFASNYVQF